MPFIPDNQSGFVPDKKKKESFIPQVSEEGFFKPTEKVRLRDVAREAFNILGSGELVFGKAIAGAVVPYTKDFKDLEAARQKEIEMENKVMETIKKNQAEGKDTKKLKSILVGSLNNRGASDEEINEALKLTNKQIIGGAVQTALDVATAGTYGAKAAQTGRLFTPAEKLITKQVAPTVLGQFKVGLKSAGVGGLVGYGYDVSTNLQEDEADLTPGFATLLGMGIPLAGKTGQYFSKEQKAIRKEAKIGEIVESYKSAVNPLKSDIKKIEVKGGRDLDDTLLFMAEEEVVPRKDSAGRLDTKLEVDKLVDKKSNVDVLLAESLDDTQKINDLNKIRNQAKSEIAKTENNAEILQKKKEDIDNLIDAEIARNGNMVSDKTLHDIKNGMWSVGFDQNRITKSPSAKKIGNIMKTIIEENNSDNFNIQEMNKLSAQYRGAIDLLNSVHGNTIPGGKIGGYFYRIMIGVGLEKVLGSIPGLKGAAFFIGQFIGQHYYEFINNPERVVNEALKQAKKIKLDKRSEKILDIFEQGLKKQSIDEWNKILQPSETKLLPPVSGEPLGPAINAGRPIRVLPPRTSKEILGTNEIIAGGKYVPPKSTKLKVPVKND